MASVAGGLNIREKWLAVAIVGILTGLLSGLLGIGGAAILIPGLVDVLGMSQHRATGTSLFVIIPTAVVAAIVYTLSAQMDWPLVALFSATAVGGALLGTALNARISAGLLRRLFGIFLVMVAIRFLIPGNELANPDRPPNILSQHPLVTLGEATLGLIAGFMSGLLGIGGGQILTPGMVFLFGIEQKLAQGISIAFIVPTAISGAWAHYRRGNVETGVGFVLIPCSMAAGVLGAWMAQFIDSSNLRFGFALFLLYASSRMLAPKMWTAVLRRGRTA